MGWIEKCYSCSTKNNLLHCPDCGKEVCEGCYQNHNHVCKG